MTKPETQTRIEAEDEPVREPDPTHEKMRLFTPAPTQLAGQTSMEEVGP